MAEWLYVTIFSLIVTLLGKRKPILIAVGLENKKKGFTPTKVGVCLFRYSVILFYYIGRTVRLMPAAIKHCS